MMRYLRLNKKIKWWEAAKVPVGRFKTDIGGLEKHLQDKRWVNFEVTLFGAFSDFMASPPPNVCCVY